jgi:hypothetical protein
MVIDLGGGVVRLYLPEYKMISFTVFNFQENTSKEHV